VASTKLVLGGLSSSGGSVLIMLLRYGKLDGFGTGTNVGVEMIFGKNCLS